jgi:hypothetical protein
LPPGAEAISLQVLIDQGLSFSSSNGELTFSNFGFSSGGGGCVSGPGGSVTAQASGFRYDIGLYCGGGGEEISLTFDVTASKPIDSVELTMSGASIYSIDPAGFRVEGPLVGEYSDSAGASVSVTHADPIPAGFVCTDPEYTGFCTFAGTGAVSGADSYASPTSSLVVASAFTLVGAGDDIGDPQFDWAEISYSTVPEPTTALLLGLGVWGLGAIRKSAR